MELIPMSDHVPRIAVIDTDPVLLKELEDRIESHGWVACATSDWSHAAGFVARAQADLVIFDIGQKGERAAAWHALDALKHAAETGEIPVIVCAAVTAVLRRDAGTLQQYGVEVLSKPCRPRRVLRKVEAVLRRRRTRRGWHRR